MKLRRLAIIVAVVAAVGCNRDPKVVARKYVESGNRYLEAGKIKEASLMYRNALQKFPKFAEGHYRMALLALKAGDSPVALAELKRALQPDLQPPLPLALKTDATEKWIDLMAPYPLKETVDAFDAAAKQWEKDDKGSHLGPRLHGEARLIEVLVDAARLQDKDTRPFAKFRHWLDRADPARTAAKGPVDKLLGNALENFQTALKAKPDDPTIVLKVTSILNTLDRQAEAEQLLQAVIDRGKAEPAHYATLAFMRRQKPESAIPVLQAGLTRFFTGEKLPQQAGAMQIPGLLLGLGSREQAQAAIEQVKRCGKNEEFSYMWAYRAYTQLNDQAAAVRQLEEGIKALPARKESFQKHLMFGYFFQRKNAEALQIAEEILKTNPKDVEARTTRTSLNLFRQDPATSIKELEEIVQQSRGNAIASFNLGRAYMMRGASGDLRLARRQFEQALESSPSHMGALMGLAQTQLGERDFEGALRNASAALKVDPNNAAARLLRSSALLGQGQLADARTEVNSVLKQFPDNSEALLQMAVLEKQAGKWKVAEGYAAKSAAAVPGSFRPFALMVECIVKQGKNEIPRALAVVRAQAEKYNSRADFLELYGNLLVGNRQLDDAINVFRKAAGIQTANPDRAVDMYLKAGSVQRMKGDNAGAIQTGLKARSVNPKYAPSSAFLALVYDATGQSAEARKVYDDALKLDPNNIVMLNNCAYLLAESGGDLDKALTYAQRALQQPRPANAASSAMDEVQDTVGWIYIKKQMPDNALGMLNAIVDRNPKNPTYRYHLAMALDQKGQKAEARRHLEQAMQNNPRPKDLEDMKRLLAKQR
jgi:tetratricopeptide (TPR) repeat protein